jgi:hypothetical protein
LTWIKRRYPGVGDDEADPKGMTGGLLLNDWIEVAPVS